MPIAVLQQVEFKVAADRFSENLCNLRNLWIVF